MSTDTTPELGPLKYTKGLLGQVSYSTKVTYPGEEPSLVTFVGSIYGGPVLMQTTSDPAGGFVTNPNRFGPFGPDWVRAFFAAT